MGIIFEGEFSFDKLHLINNFIFENEIQLWIMEHPIYVYECKIEKVNKDTIKISTC